MTEETNVAQEEVQKNNDKEINFRALREKHRMEMEQERQARIELEQKLEHLQRKETIQEEDDDDDEPYVAPKKLDKKLAKFGQATQSEIQKAMEIAKQTAKEELKQEIWLENNSDFHDILQNAEKFAQKHPKLAETILRMPPGFERQKLVYENIKELGLHKPEQKQSSIQDKVNANQRSPYYMPSGISNAPYAQVGDFSEAGQKNAYQKMQELKSKLRL